MAAFISGTIWPAALFASPDGMISEIFWNETGLPVGAVAGTGVAGTGVAGMGVAAGGMLVGGMAVSGPGAAVLAVRAWTVAATLVARLA